MLLKYNSQKSKLIIEDAHSYITIKGGFSMRLTIGENIKIIRKYKDITQEQLAEMLGVSCQSVSRWELGVCYPDMELLPALAEIFEVTIDKLLGVDNIVEKKEVDEYLNRFQIAISKGEIEECISIAREGVSKYPNNHDLLNKLMYALFVSGDETGNISDFKENREKYDSEIVSLGERIIKFCPNQDIRLEATARLAFHHCEMGRKSIGRVLYETLPSQETCRENQIWWALEEDEKSNFIRNRIRADYDSLKRYIWILGTAGGLSNEESISVLEKVCELDKIIYDDKMVDNSWASARLHYDIAKYYVKINKFDCVYYHLNAMTDIAKAFDNRPEIFCFSSLLLGKITENKTDNETADTRTLCDIIYSDWLSDAAFHSVRDKEEFKKVLRGLCAAT